MRTKCNSKCNSKCNNKYECVCKKTKKINCNCIKPSICYEKCEALAKQSRELYDEALCYNKKIEKYNTLSLQAECRAKQLEEEAKQAWCEYNQYIQSANTAAHKGEELMKTSCKLLEESQECYNGININTCSHHHHDCNYGCKDDYICDYEEIKHECKCEYKPKCNCGCSSNCSCGCSSNCNCGC